MAYLIYEPNTLNKRIYELKFGVNTIGRGEDNTIVVLHGYLSRHHAKLAIGGDRFILTDLRSLNGTFVNEFKINQCEIKDGDLIRLGNVLFTFVDTVTPSQPKWFSDVDSEISIVKQVSPEKTRVEIKDLLDQDKKNRSVLKLRHQDDRERSVNKLQLLLEISKELSSPEEPDKLLQKILDLLLEIMKVDRAAIMMIDETTGELEQKALKISLGAKVETPFYSQKIIDFVLERGDGVLTHDARLDLLFNDSVSVMKQGIHAAMCVPLKPRDLVIGVLYVDNLSMADIYSEEDLEFLTCIANQAAIAIENSRLYKKMQAEAVMRDKLERFFAPAVTKKLREQGQLGIVEAEVTALFSDISNFTKMSSIMEPRQVIEMLHEYFEMMVEEIVFPYEGTLEKYIGDALVAVWGAPYQQSDDADRAVRAAIQMQWAVLRLNEKWMQEQKRPISIHIGLNTGKVAAGNIGSEKMIQYAHIGDTTNVASRICTLAQSGEVLISQSTFRKLKDRKLPLEKMPLVRVKGKSEPLQVYRVHWEKMSGFKC